MNPKRIHVGRDTTYMYTCISANVWLSNSHSLCRMRSAILGYYKAPLKVIFGSKLKQFQIMLISVHANADIMSIFN